MAKESIVVRAGKGNKDRVTLLPQSLRRPLEEHLARVKIIHAEDLKAGWGRVKLPEAVDRK